MTTEQDAMVVFKGGAGEHYLVPLETIEQGRVPAQRKAEVEQLLADTDDVSGYFILMTISQGILRRAYTPETPLVPVLDLSASASPEVPRFP